MKSPFWRIGIHLLLGVSFLVLPYIFAPNGLGQIAQVAHNPHERTNLFAYILMLGFFYLNYYVLIPKLYFTKKYIYYALSICVSFGIIVGMLLSIDRQDILETTTHLEVPPPPSPHFPPPPPPKSYQQKPPLGFELSHALFLFLVGIFVSLSLQINERLRQTERENLNTKLSFLKAQINPHFLFNTLNTIYSLAIEQSPRTADVVVKLAALMRYVMREADTEKVPLAKELEYIDNYVALQQLRLDETAAIDFKIEGHPNGLQIAPLILISFIENTFKYGINPQEKSIVKIHLSIEKSILHLHTFNKKVRRFHDEETSSGIGLENARTRLGLLYPNKNLLFVNETDEDFRVELTLELS